MKFAGCMTVCMLGVFATSAALAQDEDVLVSRTEVKIEEHVNLLEKTSEELNTKEGRTITAVVSAVAAYFGFPPNVVAIGTTANTFYQDSQRSTGEAYHFSVRGPAGYTLCLAKPSNTSAPYKGIESSNGSTFNSQIYRSRDELTSALWLYIVVPKKTKTTRSMGKFDTIWIRHDVWLEGTVQRKCQTNRTHPWKSYDNVTRLNVPRGR